MSSAPLLILCGSLRKDSLNMKLAREAARHYGGESVTANLDLPLYNGDVEADSGIPDAVQELSDQIAQAQAVIISSPEYNQSLSGVIKNALDWVSRTDTNPWLDKPVALLTAAAGRAGGARAQYALRLAMSPFRPDLLTGPEILIASAHQEFNSEGELTNERYQAAIAELMQRLKKRAENADAVV